MMWLRYQTTHGIVEADLATSVRTRRVSELDQRVIDPHTGLDLGVFILFVRTIKRPAFSENRISGGFRDGRNGRAPPPFGRIRKKF